ncbi:methoxyneurosporene dehydrogenase [Deinococcus piscis]|uniref:Methoxyneurosporene dehydrogenase n=1 Tax=Deinococcus piscis TaxID=394230 RepID=A0ABQ3JWQ1_9DEIO|nr:NAD(P)/FAD-dependent oxidoreductase [Deinococcus piscis]GHF93326.1 methoxyneurosporene dehydrogenase [Deinococcus piscis]
MKRLPSSVTVIGAGFAGLAAALRLRQAGANVTVLEALDTPGGKAALGYRDFSSGPTVVTMPQVLRALHARLDWAAPQLTPAVPTTRYQALDGRTFAPQALSVAGSLDPTLAQLSRAEGQRYAELLRLSRQLYRDAADTFLFGPPPTLPALARYGLSRGWRAQPGRSLASLVQSGSFLTPFWLRFATYLGADPYRAPAVLHNVAWVELGGGVWHLSPEGSGASGLLGLAARMAAEAERLGVHFEYGTRVRRLHTGGQRVVAAHTDRGDLPADAFVSAADISLTRQWLGQPAPDRPQGVSGFAVQLRLADDVGQAHHIFWPLDYRGEWQDIRAGRLPLDPTLYLHLDGRQGFLLVNAPATPRRAADRAEYAGYLLRHLQTRFPLPVKEALALSPADYARTAATGALYGNAPHGLSGSLRPGWRLRGPSGRLENLRQVGGTVHPGGGVPLSLLSGWNGAGELLGLPYDPLGGPEFVTEAEPI